MRKITLSKVQYANVLEAIRLLEVFDKGVGNPNSLVALARNAVEFKKSVEVLKKEAYERGVKAAAEIASQYDGSCSHPYPLEQCILAKLNLLVGGVKPKKRVRK